jgi:hypothetical protein
MYAKMVGGMDDKRRSTNFLHRLPGSARYKVLGLILVVALVAGIGTGYVLASTQSGGGSGNLIALPNSTPKTAQQDERTFRDFAEGKLTKKPEPKSNDSYEEGTHLLVRDGAVPVALTSSVVDLSEFENKKVKVFGETQKAIKEGWLMDVGKVEVQE